MGDSPPHHRRSSGELLKRRAALVDGALHVVEVGPVHRGDYLHDRLGVFGCGAFCELRPEGVLQSPKRQTDLVNPPSTRRFCPVM